jgi:hypothetical protein
VLGDHQGHLRNLHLLIRLIVSLAGHKAVNGYVDCYLKRK